MCEKPTASGAGGVQTFRITLVNKASYPPESFDLLLLENGKSVIRTQDFSLIGNTKIIDAVTGLEVRGVKVSLEIVNTGKLAFYINPNYKAIKEKVKKKRTPKAISLLVDMSETSALKDPSLSRTNRPSGWILEMFNSDTSIGSLDLFSVLLLQNGELNRTNLLFGTWPSKGQYIAADGKTRGFVPTSEDNKNKVSNALARISNNEVSGLPPVYMAIEASVQDLLSVSINEKEQLFNPAVVAILTERDMHLLDRTKTNKFSSAKAALQKGSVPFFAIVSPKSDSVADKQWNDYLSQLCSLSQASGQGKRGAWGNMLQIPPGRRGLSEDSVLTMLGMASHSLKGHFNLDVKYTLTGAQKGKQYWISFKLKAQIGKEINNVDPSTTPFISFKVNN